jgi:hypothetical protein
MRPNELTEITDPAVLAEFPAIAPAKDELADIISIGKGRSVSLYQTNPGRPRAGSGRVVRCEVCGTLLRPGQPHSAVEPEPHQTLDMLTVVEPLPVED